MPTFLVERTPGAAWVPGVDVREQPLWDEHAASMDHLLARGHVVLGGPAAGAGGEALLAMESASEVELRSLLASDPWCVDADILRIGRIREWRVFLDARGR